MKIGPPDCRLRHPLHAWIVSEQYVANVCAMVRVEMMHHLEQRLENATWFISFICFVIFTLDRRHHGGRHDLDVLDDAFHRDNTVFPRIEDFEKRLIELIQETFDCVIGGS